MSSIWLVLFWSSVGGLVSVLLASALVLNKTLREKMVLYAVPFGAGALIAISFLSTIPEALDSSNDHRKVLIYVLVGFLTFFIIERLGGWLHGHGDNTRNQTQGMMVIVGDTLHNMIDGMAIGLAFLVDTPTGIITSLAVASHELPQEIGDFSILLSRGFSTSKVIIINILSGCGTVIAALATFTLGSAGNWQPGYVLAIAAGFFIYIAASDIIPGIHEKPRVEGSKQAAMLIFGVLCITIISSV